MKVSCLYLFFFTGVKSFDRESKSSYTFLVFASDGTRTGSANVRVTVSDVNDERPEFLDGPYVRKVKENQKAGAVVGYVTAKDKDEGGCGCNLIYDDDYQFPYFFHFPLFFLFLLFFSISHLFIPVSPFLSVFLTFHLFPTSILPICNRKYYGEINNRETGTR